MMDYVNAFWVGGLICALVQILMEKTKMMPGRIMVLLVVTGAVISVFGWYEPFQEFAGAGASVPLLGFGNVLMKGVKEAVKEQGILGLFAGGFRAGAVGTSAALIFGYLASLVFKPKMKAETVTESHILCPGCPDISSGPYPRWRQALWRAGRREGRRLWSARFWRRRSGCSAPGPLSGRDLRRSFPR